MWNCLMSTSNRAKIVEYAVWTTKEETEHSAGQRWNECQFYSIQNIPSTSVSKNANEVITSTRKQSDL